jgi:hypothetical protein
LRTPRNPGREEEVKQVMPTSASVTELERAMGGEVARIWGLGFWEGNGQGFSRRKMASGNLQLCPNGKVIIFGRVFLKLVVFFQKLLSFQSF